MHIKNELQNISQCGNYWFKKVSASRLSSLSSGKMSYSAQEMDKVLLLLLK